MKRGWKDSETEIKENEKRVIRKYKETERERQEMEKIDRGKK